MISQYTNPDHPKHKEMENEIGKRMNFTSLRYNRLEDLIEAIGIGKENLCTYCFDGKDE